MICKRFWDKMTTSMSQMHTIVHAFALLIEGQQLDLSMHQNQYFPVKTSSVNKLHGVPAYLQALMMKTAQLACSMGSAMRELSVIATAGLCGCLQACLVTKTAEPACSTGPTMRKLSVVVTTGLSVCL